ncbi:hypothetical protein SteCoe_34904 [Stentor coeruleus]|uniref:Uncharacterized protein n=1 Tax=Stentor coeruleus TaxID=5963 RepID=A0A1R2ATI7_9CILI|nr:hypothetical protein SteCoe_34904 [Stentor coeruleus]
MHPRLNAALMSGSFFYYSLNAEQLDSLLVQVLRSLIGTLMILRHLLLPFEASAEVRIRRLARIVCPADYQALTYDRH